MPQPTKQNDGTLSSTGGRILNVTALGRDISQARQNAYDCISKIAFKNCFYRSDIGKITP